ncbi:ArsR/SmtB family transcription factor [Campylobacter insulaenigrae]|uniref:Transcriptional regulator, ArsR family n=1 Tax=Campylobacter insulaenigrae NCTC 12927 TaxID=1031564 RepID=A0A0A8H125_9BACT|nr:metalloregulator ArsR/SmtB family transcription factor [Campylobacter insulaenigrae]AJC87612.1 transcriptional regulator, ArsR family [Campylobacter insulaenigrae NCTC 12927]MCR6590597.1 metalloregulator ArsR/SmtB family transcription factor [Campylobacter insulaenigrae]MCR6592134.1 metalloregulator ArsR/SmtB family transcription factor [Campylobacter insulaenigrae]VEH93728.1 ArsR family transcriptional regulator [Campylobacter insulaenigrae]VEJ53522.1 ArsR family transcriptional regulator 
MQNFLKITSAINDESRILILAFLQENGKLCVCDLQNSLNMSQSRLSRHLKILKEAGFLDVDRQGVWAYYKIKENLNLFCQDTLKNIHHLSLNLPQFRKVSCPCPKE